MKTRLSHLLTMLLWLAMLTAYVVALSYLPHALGLLLILPAGVGCIAVAKEWSDYLNMNPHRH